MRATANHQTGSLRCRTKVSPVLGRLSSEAKVILSIDPVERTDEQIRICQNNRRFDN